MFDFNFYYKTNIFFENIEEELLTDYDFFEHFEYKRWHPIKFMIYVFIKHYIYTDKGIAIGRVVKFLMELGLIVDWVSEKRVPKALMTIVFTYLSLINWSIVYVLLKPNIWDAI